MAKILKQLVFGQKKNPPAPPMPDYQGEEAAKGEFADHDYENISKFTSEGRSSVRFQEPKEPELVVFENYSEPADLLRNELSTFGHEDESDPVYMAPVDDARQASNWAANEEEDMYCVPYEGSDAPPPLPSPCLGPGYITHKIGRKTTLVFASSSYITSWLAVAYAPTISVIYIGRVTCGLSTGICCVAVPAYIVEIAPTEIRGFLSSGFQLAYSIGVFLIISVGTCLRWSWLAVVGACLTTCALCLIVVMPESPTWLMRESRTHEALKGLKFLKGKNADLKKELQDLADNINETKSNKFSFKELLDPTFHKPALITACLVFFQQASGINVIMSYTVEIFASIGSAVTPNISSSLVAAVQVIGTLLGGILMDRSGRKRLYVISGTCMTVSIFILATYSYVLKFRVMSLNSHVYGWIPLMTLIMFVFSFSLGVGPIPFVMAPEMSPIRFRSAIIAMASVLCSLFAFIATKLFEDMRTFFGLYGLFWTYSFFSFLSALFGYFILPETKGLTLRQISRSFSVPTEDP